MKGFHLRRGSDSKAKMIPSFICFLFALTTAGKKKKGQAQYKAVAFWNPQSSIYFLAVEPGTNESPVHVISAVAEKRGENNASCLLSRHSSRVCSAS